ncbi:MAG: lipase family protein [Candidatus Riflebacteria bacterium]|nr:lipase family protein [Candidatus Riflebacteria bacterium]
MEEQTIDSRNMSVLIHALDIFPFPESFQFDASSVDFSMEKARFFLVCSRLVYESPEFIRNFLQSPGWQFDVENEFRFISCRHTDLFLMKRGSDVFLTFRGTETENFWDWRIDADVTQCVDRVLGENGGQVHCGFSEALNTVWDDLQKVLSDWKVGESSKIWITGHSLGAAIAELAGARLSLTLPENSIRSLYTFGKPKVGDARFSEFVDGKLAGRAFFIANNRDIVPRIPPEKWGYAPSGKLWLINESHKIEPAHVWVPEIPDFIAGQLKLTVNLFRSSQMETLAKFLDKYHATKIWTGIGMALEKIPPEFLEKFKMLIPPPVLDHFPSEYLKAF